jgi:hypothetical protein
MEIPVSRTGKIRVICDGQPSATCTATILSFEGQVVLANSPLTMIGGSSKVMMEVQLPSMILDLVSAANRLPVYLETVVSDRTGGVCRNVYSSLLLGPGQF